MASGRSTSRSNRTIKYKALVEFWGADKKFYKPGDTFSPAWPENLIASAVEAKLMTLAVESEPVIEEPVKEVIVEEPQRYVGFSDSVTREVDDGKNSST